MTDAAHDIPWLRLFPEQASTLAVRTDALFLVQMGIILLVVGGVLMLLVYFAVRYRQERHVERGNLPRGRRARRAEIAWALIPFLIFLGFFGWGARIYLDIGSPPADALEIQALAKQWMWKFQHPDGQREINELHVPVGRPVRLTLISQDVIHSFFVPAFRVKQDVVPGRYTHTWFEATRTGRFHLLCTEFCGTGHSRMRGTIVVMEPERYARWLERQGPRDDLAAAGERLFRRFGCSGCHAADSSVHAPSLAGIYGNRVQLTDGVSKRVDEGYLRDSILLPAKDVVAGFEPIMPSFKGQVDEAELLELVAYIKSLRQEEVIGE